MVHLQQGPFLWTPKIALKRGWSVLLSSAIFDWGAGCVGGREKGWGRGEKGQGRRCKEGREREKWRETEGEWRKGGKGGRREEYIPLFRPESHGFHLEVELCFSWHKKSSIPSIFFLAAINMINNVFAILDDSAIVFSVQVFFQRMKIKAIYHTTTLWGFIYALWSGKKCEHNLHKSEFI